ncbi:MAG: 3-phosphoserine/phosphohydroxythreonine transaminase [Ignavibacteria bacterium]|jgi:phosphoserine aminotransferase|nr:3-phosphoserine/phosphohydroxythreonine transaminase [Ignavibacteria bacterium]
MSRAFNFSAGPAVLPLEVLEASKQAIYDYNGLGMSIMEMSHRSKEYDEIIKTAQADVLKLMELSPNEYDVLFLGGGASLQFYMVPFNFLRKKANYITTGVWASKAAKEAEKVGETKIIASSKDTNYNYIPKEYKADDDADYLHITTNNTIYGTEWCKDVEGVKIPVVADMSSDMFAVQRDFKRYDMIYAGAQKNIGPAGVTLVVIKKSFLEKRKDIVYPNMLNYKLHIDKESMFNTPPCMNIYVVGQVLKWVMKTGLGNVEANNRKKAAVLYDFMDNSNGFYTPTVKVKEDRSLMNVAFLIKGGNPDLEAKFVKEAREKYNMANLKGHRDVGGLRASIYNACPIEWVEALTKFMGEFQVANK